MEQGVHLSVVIPTFNNLAVLRRCIAAWRDHSCNAGCNVEIIVIEDGCRDATPEFLAETQRTEWGKRWLRWFHEDDAHELVCTNRGLSEASGALILAWQDDMLLNASWFVPEIVRTFDAYPEVGLLSLSRGLNCSPFADPINGWDDLHDRRRLQSTIGRRGRNWWELQEVDIVIRPWVVRGACIRKVGFLDERFRPTEWDEADLCFRIRSAGWKIATHGYERLGAYIHLGSTTLTFSEEYKTKVLKNGHLFHALWDADITRSYLRRRRNWLRRPTLSGVFFGFRRALVFGWNYAARRLSSE